MCQQCWESYYAGYFTKREVYQCSYYLDILRNHRNELRRIPKRDPDDPVPGEGLLPFYGLNWSDQCEYCHIVRMNNRALRRQLQICEVAGQGAERSRRECLRGVVERPNWVETQLNDYNRK